MSSENKDLAWFIRNRPEQCQVVTEIIDSEENYNVIIVNAPVKSGKKDIAIIYKLHRTGCDKKYVDQTIIISALHRKADKAQRQELSCYFGPDYVFSITNQNSVEKCLKKIKDIMDKTDQKITIILDELDYGSNEHQLLSKIWNFAKKNYKKINRIAMSATPEESLPEYVNSIDKQEKKKIISYTPAQSYFGLKKLIQAHRFKQSESFFESKFDTSDSSILSKQGIESIKTLLSDTSDKSNKKHIGILRLTGNAGKAIKNKKKKTTLFEKIKQNKEKIIKEVNQKYNQEVKFKFKMMFVSSKAEDKNLIWDSDDEWDDLDKNNAYLIIVNEVAKRSTEWRCQPYLSWYHTHRGSKTPENTNAQDYSRPVYYETSFNGIAKFEEINFIVYGNLEEALINSGLKSRKDTKKNKIIISSNVTCKPYKKKQINSCIYDYNPKEEEEEKEEILKKNPPFDKIINFKVKHINGEINQEEWEIPDKTFHEYKHLKGFRLTNMRGGLGNWLIDACIHKIEDIKPPPVKYKTDIEKDKNEGLNNRSKIRINVYYENGEKDPNKFKFCKRENIKAEEVRDVRNKSMW